MTHADAPREQQPWAPIDGPDIPVVAAVPPVEAAPVPELRPTPALIVAIDAAVEKHRDAVVAGRYNPNRDLMHGPFESMTLYPDPEKPGEKIVLKTRPQKDEFVADPDTIENPSLTKPGAIDIDYQRRRGEVYSFALYRGEKDGRDFMTPLGNRPLPGTSSLEPRDGQQAKELRRLIEISSAERPRGRARRLLGRGAVRSSQATG